MISVSKFVTFQLTASSYSVTRPTEIPATGVFHRHARVHQREHSAAHARHRSRTVRFHDFAGNADGVTKIIFARDDRLERTFRQRAVADLAPARAAKSSRFRRRENGGKL